MVKYFSFHFWAREDGVFLPSSYYSKVYEALKSLLATEHFTISPIRTKNKKEVEDGIWVFEDFRIYLATPFLELVTQNILKIYENLNALFDDIYLKRISCRTQQPKIIGNLLSGVFAQKDGACLEYDRQPEIFSEMLRRHLLSIYYQKFGVYPEDQRFFFVIKDGLKKQHLIESRIEYFGKYEIFASKELLEMFCQTFCVK
ncbi:hypothetical protein [Caldicellulosiruptor saccharolyticus]|uniref:hypothetical protein n=1 Tax=Caldicellulosiruptor saccharolyticus TaxID=44001 RepID=UPI001E63546A|nr:hypothetical protein [Caldicellulosiruptor saccharolyticus]